MKKDGSTKERLLAVATQLFWTRGYSNVSVRDITGDAGVDAALVSRYFGGKKGLFDATLLAIPEWTALSAPKKEVLEAAVQSFSQPHDPNSDEANAFTLLLTNILDPEIGDEIRAIVHSKLADPLAEKLGGAKAYEHAAMVLSILFGAALMRKSFHLKGMLDKSPEEIASQLRHLGRAALDF